MFCLRNKNKAFTLIELLVVVSIISLLSTVVLGALGDAREKARIVKAQQDLNEIYKAFQLYVSDNNGLGPKSELTTGAQYIPWNTPNCEGDHDISSGLPNVPEYDRPNQHYVDYYESELSPYLSEIPLDPWGGRCVVDAVYDCGTSRGATPVGCKDTNLSNDWIFALYSGGPDLGANNPAGNGSAPAHYDSDNIVLQICDHAN